MMMPPTTTASLPPLVRVPTAPPTNLLAPLVRPLIVPTLWGGDGAVAAFGAADEFLDALFRGPVADRTEPEVWVQVHTTEPREVAFALVNRYGATRVRLVVGVGVDWIARAVAKGERSVAWGVEQLLTLARKAVAVGALALCWNAEAGWKRPPTSPERARLVELIRTALARVATEFPATALVQWFTSFDHPTFHSEFPWEAWLGAASPILRALPQVYAAPGEAGLMAHRGALPAREARALASWAQAVRKGWVRADAPAGSAEDAKDVDWTPYYQLHSVRQADTVGSAVKHDVVAGWALQSRSDRDGRAALVSICALRRMGLWGAGAVEAAQRALGFTGKDVDGACGPETHAALARATGLPVIAPTAPRAA